MSEKNKPLWAQNIPTRTQIKWNKKMSEDKEFCLSSKELDTQELHSGSLGLFNKRDVKEFIKQDTEFLDINENLIGFKLSDVVVTAINLMFNQRTKKLAGKELI